MGVLPIILQAGFEIDSWVPTEVAKQPNLIHSPTPAHATAPKR